MAQQLLGKYACTWDSWTSSWIAIHTASQGHGDGVAPSEACRFLWTPRVGCHGNVASYSNLEYKVWKKSCPLSTMSNNRICKETPFFLPTKENRLRSTATRLNPDKETVCEAETRKLFLEDPWDLPTSKVSSLLEPQRSSNWGGLCGSSLQPAALCP